MSRKYAKSFLLEHAVIFDRRAGSAACRKNLLLRSSAYIFLLAISVGAISFNGQVVESVPVDAFQAGQEKLCREQRKGGERSYSFRVLEKSRGDKGAYGRKKWYDPLKPVFPFLKSPLDKYGVDDIRFIKTTYGRPVPLGETERSKQIRRKAEEKLKQIDRLGEQRWQDWLRRHPNADEGEKEKAKLLLLAQGLEAEQLRKFDWRESGLDLGPVSNQGPCNTCWAFSTVDAMQVSRRLDALRSDRTLQAGAELRPSVRQLVSCMLPKTPRDFCELNWHGKAFSYMVDEGLPLGGGTRYVPEDFLTWTCGKEESVRALTWDFVSAEPQKIPSVSEIKRALVLYGPVVATLNLDNCIRLYGGGTFNEEQQSDGPYHMILIAGWDDDRGAWLTKNSYGEGWGEGGFGWVKYNSNNIGKWAAWIMADPKEEERLSKRGIPAVE